MKINRRVLFHSASVLILLAVYLFLRLGGGKSEKPTEVLTLTAEDIDQISYTDRNGKPVNLILRDGTWICRDVPSLPLQQSFSENMLSRLTSLTAASTVKRDSEDASQYGLTDPSNKIQIKGKKTDCQILVGIRNMTTGDYYISSGNDEIYLIDQTFVNLFSTPCLSMMERETAPSFDYTDLRSLTITDGDRMLAFSPDEDGRWTYRGEKDKPRPASASAVLSLYSNLLGVRFNEPVSFEELKKEETSPTVKDMQSETGLFSKHLRFEAVYDKDGSQAQWTLRLAEGKDGRWYLCSDGSAAVYQSEAGSLSGLLAVFTTDYADYTVPYMGNQRVEKIDAEIYGAQYHLKKSDGQTFNRLYYQLISLTADKIGTYEVPGEEPVAKILYTASDGKTSLVCCFEYGQGELLVVVDNEASWLVNKKKILALKE